MLFLYNDTNSTNAIPRFNVVDPLPTRVRPDGRVWSSEHTHTILMIFPTIPGELYLRVYCL